MKEELRVRYKIEERIDEDFDHAITLFCHRWGWLWYGRGFNHKTGERDIAFDREEVADPLEILLQ